MKLKRLTPRDLKTFDDKFKLLDEYEDRGKWHNYERGYIAAVWSGWFEVENGNDPHKDSSKEEVVDWINDPVRNLEEYNELCMEINTVYVSGRQPNAPPVKDPN